MCVFLIFRCTIWPTKTGKRDSPPDGGRGINIPLRNAIHSKLYKERVGPRGINVGPAMVRAGGVLVLFVVM